MRVCAHVYMYVHVCACLPAAALSKALTPEVLTPNLLRVAVFRQCRGQGHAGGDQSPGLRPLQRAPLPLPLPLRAASTSSQRQQADNVLYGSGVRESERG